MADDDAVRWVLQDNLGSRADLAALQSALDRYAISWTAVSCVPFDDAPPDVPTEGRVLFYGATTLVTNVARARRWRPGVYFDEERFAFEALRAGYGDALLNASSEVLTVAEIAARDDDPEALYFVRPANDLKEFAGMVRSFGELRAWAHGLASSDGPAGLRSRLQLAAPVNIAREWRVVVVDGAAVAASQYRVSGRLAVDADVPDAVRAFAEAMAARYAPAPVFMLDVGEVDEALRVIETNCFHSAGFYACDVRAIVRRVTAYAKRG